MSKNGPYLIKNGPYPSIHVRLREIFHKEKYLSQEKVILMEKFANHYKMVFEKKRPTRVVISLVSLIRLKKPCQQKNVLLLNGISIHHRNKRNGPESWLFCWFLSPSFDNLECAYACVLLSFGTKTGLRAIALYRKDRVLLSKHK